mgnify:CR=1 FL=1
MFYKIIDEKTKKVNVGLGTNQDFYESIDMIKCNDDEVEQGCDSCWYLKGYAPQKPLEDLRQKKIRELKANCSNYIYSQYPIYKQLNVANGLATEEEISEMTTFIQQARLTCEEIEQKINSVKTQKKLEEISINFN